MANLIFKLNKLEKEKAETSDPISLERIDYNISQIEAQIKELIN